MTGVERGLSGWENYWTFTSFYEKFIPLDLVLSREDSLATLLQS